MGIVLPSSILPFFDLMKNTAVFSHFNSLSSSWASRYRKDSFMRRRQFFSSQIFPLFPNLSSVLDLGCGCGDLSELFVGQNVTHLELIFLRA